MKTEVTFQTEGGSFSGTVDERGVFHEALEHLLPDHLRVGRRITIRTPGGDPVYPDMFVGETVAHFRTTTFTVRSEPLRANRAHGVIWDSITSPWQWPTARTRGGSSERCSGCR